MNTCNWTEDRGEWGDSWDTSCDNKFEFMVGGPDENEFKFCPYCGGQLQVVEASK